MHSYNIKYMATLDHLRFYAAILIVIFHLANGELVHYWHFDIGVALFFTLSGYLFFAIAYQHKDEKIIYWKFIYNRVLRIYPLITLLFLMAIIIVDNFTAIDFVNLFGLNLPGKARDSWIVGDWGYQYLSFNWWTIGVEFTFYLLFPLIFNMYQKYGINILIKLVSLIIILKIFLYYSLLEEHGWKKLAIAFNYSFFSNFDIFIIGMIISYFEKKGITNQFIASISESKCILVLYIILMWFLLINYSDDVPIPLITSFSAILCGGLIILYQRSFANIQSSSISKILSVLGSMSFSIYLLHDFVKDGLQGLGIDKWFINMFVTSFTNDQEVIKFSLLMLYIPVILVISRLTFTVIEYPFLSMRVKYFIKE